MTRLTGSRRAARRAFVWPGVCFTSAIVASTAMPSSLHAGPPARHERIALVESGSRSSSTAQQDTSLCRLISAKEYFGVLKAPIGSVRGRAATIMGNRIVTCYYRPTSMPGAGGTITYIFAGNAATYGNASDGSAYLAGAEQMAKEIAAHF